MNKQTAAITQEQIDQARRRFRQDGGIIRKLPDERVPLCCLVGARHGTCMDMVPQYRNSRV